jgi:protein-tyrosine phosphatase
MAFRVCFVCMGNICRSPMAEAVFRRLVNDAGLDGRVEVASAGTGDWHVGHGADRRAVAALHGRGYDGSAHRARQFGPDWFARYDLVVALDRDNERALRRLATGTAGSSTGAAGAAGAAGKVRLLRSYGGAAVGDLDVPDPYYGGPEGFEHVLDLVEEACQALLDEVRRAVPA